MIHIFCFIEMYKNPDQNKTTQFILRFKLVKHKSRLIFPMSVYFLHNDNLAVSLISFFFDFLGILPGYIALALLPSVMEGEFSYCEYYKKNDKFNGPT